MMPFGLMCNADDAMNFTWDPPAINYRYTLLATSSDAEGKEFSKPPLGIFAHEGNTTNIIMPDRRVTSGWSPGTVWIDEKPGIPESEKFKIIALYYWNCPSLAEHRGLARSSLDRLMGFNGSDSGRMRATLAVTRKMSHSGMRRLASTWLSDAITVAHSVPTPLALSASSTHWQTRHSQHHDMQLRVPGQQLSWLSWVQEPDLCR